MTLRTSLILATTLTVSVAASSALAQTSPSVPVRPPYGQSLGLGDAKTAAAAGEAAARAINAQMAIAVVEPTGELVLLQKMDGTQYSSTDIAIDKARSSARFRRPTKEFEDSVGARPALLGMPGALPIAGGVLAIRNGKIVGAVGVSGGTAAQDNQVAQAAAATVR